MAVYSAAETKGPAVIHGKLSLEELVSEVQRLRACGDVAASKALESHLIDMLRPTLARVAGRFTPSARGSLTADDLFQVCAIEALKLIPRYENRGSAFVSVVYRHALSACRDHIYSQAADVTVSYHERKRGTDAVRVKSRDAKVQVDASGDGPNSGLWGESLGLEGRFTVGDATPEALLSAAQSEAQVRRLVNQLPTALGDLVAWVHGIGRPRKSLREISRETGQARSKLDAQLKQAEAALRVLLERAE